MKKFNKAIYLSILLVLVIGLSFYAFSSYIDTTANAAIESRLIETAKNNVLIVNSIIERDEKQLRGTARRLATTCDVDNIAQTQEILKENMQYDSFTHLVVFTQNHLVYNESEVVTDTIDVVLNEVGNERIKAIQTPQSGNGFAINVPIEKDGKFYGVLSGVYYNEKIKELFDYSVFEGKGYFGILDHEGNVLLGSKKFQTIYHAKSIFDTLRESEFHEPYSLSLMRHELFDNKSFFTSYTIEGTRRFAYLMPLGISNWYIMSAVPAAYLTTYKAGIDMAILIFIIFMSILFLALVSVILFQNRRARHSLQSDRDTMKRIMNTVPVPIIMSDRNRKIVQLNQPAKDVFENAGVTIVGKPCSNIHLNVCHTEKCPIERLMQEGITSTTITHKNTNYFVTTTQMKDSNGEWIGFMETFQDISDIMRNKQALEERTLELETISENLSVGLLITSLEEGFPILQCNKTYLDLIDASEASVIGKPATHWLLKKEVDNVEEDIYEQLQKKGTVYLEHLLKREEGNELWVSLSGKQGTLHNQNVGIWVLVDITERKLADENIRINEERYRLAAENSEDIIVDYDILKDIMLHNEKVVELYNVDVSVEHPMQNIVLAGIIAPDYVTIFEHMIQKIQHGEGTVIDDLKTFTKDGEELWLHVIFTTIFDDNYLPVRAIGVMHNITTEKKMLMKYEREVQYRRVTMEDAALSYEVDLSEMKFLSGHEKLSMKYLNQENTDFNTVVQLMLDYLVYEEDRSIVYKHTRPEFLKEQFYKGERKVEFEYRRLLSGEVISWVLCTIHIFKDELSNHLRLIGYIKDIDEAKKQEFLLKLQAQQDLLTGLLNKVTTQKKIEEVLKEPSFKTGAFVIIDLDDFKNINDSYGHAFGDAVLSEVAQKLKSVCDPTEIIGRIGGDEFILFLNNTNTRQSEEKMHAICEMFHQTYMGEHTNYKISGSIGIAIAPQDGKDFEELYHHADIALYCAKDKGKDTYCLYDASLPAIGANKALQRIDANAGKQLFDNIPEYVLRILYEAKDPKVVLNAVLELVTRRFDFSRGYVFKRVSEDGYWENISEWCQDGMPKQSETLRHLKFGEPGYYESHFNIADEFIQYDMQSLDKLIFDKIKELHVQSFIQIAIRKNNEIVGFIGLDNCQECKKLNGADMEVLHMVAMLIDVFIFKKESEHKKV